MPEFSSIATARGPIEIAQAGTGAPVLVVHGGMGGADQGLLLADALGLSDMRVVAVSRPGYLGTPLASGRSPAAQADLLAALLDRLALPRVLLVAVSAGGVSALEFAARYPERTRGLVLVSAATGTLPAPTDYAARMPILKIMARVPFLASAQAWRRRRDPEGGAARAISDAGLRARTLADPLAGPLLRAFQTLPFRRLPARLPGTANDIETLASLPSLPLAVPPGPVLALHGTADTIAPFAQARALATASRAVDVVAIEGGEHLVLFTHLAIVRASLRRFLASLTA